MNDLDRHLPAIAAGDAAAFAAWLRGAEEPLRRSLRPFATAIDTEAVLQEALLRVWQVAARVTVDRPNALLALATRIARNLAIDGTRRRRAAPVSTEELERAAGDVAPVEPDPLLREAIARCHDKLPAAPRRAFDARLAGGADDHRLAALAEQSLNTFLKNIGRARAFLVECLARAGVTMERP